MNVILKIFFIVNHKVKMCAFSQYNIIVGQLQTIIEINEDALESYDDNMPELIDLPDLEPASPIVHPEDNDQEEPQEEEQQEEDEPPPPPLWYSETEDQHRELMERLYFNLIELYDDRTV
jgi:hypothetical protein